ncbi:LysE family translocator [Maritalea porphyrae]|uniref:Lysine transporter LysE n=1 Tax=Maritalea porphyrae TaxID=880732 RepID=A0ABQ5US69_9HYPH|nr:LysE family translocator [Maritalea porphyrae]GLQ18123.1 lysine transporter LysE [Maritalea porphyrae]
MLLGFIIATIVITLSPGPSIILLLVVSLRQGAMAGIKYSAGVISADTILISLSLLGLGALMQSSVLLFNLVKWAGIAYLIYLGIKQLRASSKVSVEATKVSGSPYLQGLGTTMLNPKAIGFFVAFFPQFIDPNQAFWPQLMLLGPLFLSMVFVMFSIIALLASRTKLLFESSKGQITLKYGAAFGLIGSGFAAAFAQRA